MRRGVVIGKFYPPHKGHSHVITTALKQVDRLAVIVCDKPGQAIPGKQRADWIKEIHPTADVITVDDSIGDDDSQGWANYTIQTLGYKPDVVFSSEDYGAAYASFMGAVHVLVDQARTTVPVSATKIRKDPFAHWEFLEGPVKSFFAKRIAVVGAESTGKTTLAQTLATHFKTSWAPEFGRQYSDEHKNIFSGATWKSEEFQEIARRQNEIEDRAAKNAEKIVFCDTDSFSTALWHERYMNTRSREVERCGAGRFYDLTFLLDVDVPFVQDGTRDGEHIRLDMHKRFLEELRNSKRQHMVLSGNFLQKTTRAIELVNEAMKENRWALAKW